MIFDKKNKKGIAIVNVLIFGAIAILIISGLTTWFGALVKSSRNLIEREKAFHIAEAGIDYYRWHLAHSQSDYQDGTGAPGPYTHPFLDKDGNRIGEFVLDIEAPVVGSTVVTVVSTGLLDSNPNISRKIKSRLAIPSLAKYAVVANDVMRFGTGTETFGPLHSNNGIRFDGLAHNVISSTKEKYNDPDHTGNDEFGVHTHVNPPPSGGINDTFRSAEAPPSVIQNRSDVFVAGRQFPVPSYDFASLTFDLAKIKTDAQSGGYYFAPSGTNGYNIILRTDDKFELRKVTSLRNRPSSDCTNVQNQSGWGTWSINNTQLVGTYNFPANGLIFVEDNLWVEGTIDTARITIAAGRFPDLPGYRKSITINKDIKYTNRDGTDVISLIAQENINTGLFSEDDLQIDAALVAQNGRAGRYYYENDCEPYDKRDKLSLYGMIATNQRYGFAYTDGSGYDERIISYDANLLYGPPPSFPLTSDHYIVLSWEEVK